jgi:hypothetical protein
LVNPHFSYLSRSAGQETVAIQTYDYDALNAFAIKSKRKPDGTSWDDASTTKANQVAANAGSVNTDQEPDIRQGDISREFVEDGSTGDLGSERNTGMQSEDEISKEGGSVSATEESNVIDEYYEAEDDERNSQEDVEEEQAGVASPVAAKKTGGGRKSARRRTDAKNC